MKPLNILTYLGSCNGSRLLEICGPPHCADIQFFTPAPMLFTKGGSIPHLTSEVFEMVSQDNFIMQAPLLNTVQMKTGVQAQNKGLGHFCSLGKNPIFMTFQDPTIVVPQTQFEQFSMPLWSRMGKLLFDADKYMDFVEAYKPDAYQVLSDGCTDISSAKKRVSKAVARSRTMLAKCLERHANSEYLSKNTSVFGAIQGGFCLKQREESLNDLSAHAEQLDGYILDGFDSNGPNIENISYDSIKEIVEYVTKKIPSNKPRIIQGCWNAVTLIDLVMAGWDLFDSSMPFLVTERGCALTLCISEEFSQNTDKSTDLVSFDSYEIDLNEEKYIEDFTPIMKNCKCLTCTKHTKAYINHLLNTKELLGGVLLMIHNLHHYLELFNVIRKSISKGTINDLRSSIARQYENHLSSKISKPIDENTFHKKKLRL